MLAFFFTLLLVAAFPVLWPWWVHYRGPRELDGLRALTLSGIAFLIATVQLLGNRPDFRNPWDQEIISSTVISLSQEEVGCRHFHRCSILAGDILPANPLDNWDSPKGWERCKNHDHDMAWMLQGTNPALNETRRDLENVAGPVPQQWAGFYTGHGFVGLREFKNQVKAIPSRYFGSPVYQSALKKYETLLSGQGALMDYPLPDAARPYYAERVKTVGFGLGEEKKKWNELLATELGRIASRKNANALIVMVSEAAPDFATALQAHWLGGKGNDTVVVLGVNRYPELSWVRVFSWTQAPGYTQNLANELGRLKTVDADSVISILSEHIRKHFERRDMTRFAKPALDGVVLSPLRTVALLVFGLLFGWFGVRWASYAPSPRREKLK